LTEGGEAELAVAATDRLWLHIMLSFIHRRRNHPKAKLFRSSAMIVICSFYVFLARPLIITYQRLRHPHRCVRPDQPFLLHNLLRPRSSLHFTAKRLQNSVSHLTTILTILVLISCFKSRRQFILLSVCSLTSNGEKMPWNGMEWNILLLNKVPCNCTIGCKAVNFSLLPDQSLWVPLGFSHQVKKESESGALNCVCVAVECPTEYLFCVE
jgi:hypothetical protein